MWLTGAFKILPLVFRFFGLCLLFVISLVEGKMSCLDLLLSEHFYDGGVSDGRAAEKTVEVADKNETS